MSQAIYDEKVEQILALLEEGKTKDEVSQHYEQEWKTLYIYMNRKGFLWDKGLETFIEKQEQRATTAPSVLTLNTKAAQIVRMLDVKHPNIQQVAAKQGFATIEELGAYMKSQGYCWSDEVQNYEEDLYRQADAAILTSVTNQVDPNDVNQFLHFLMQHQKELIELLSSEQTTKIPTYKFKGNKVNKTLTLASSAATLLEDYTKQFNITQRMIVEVALAEFFERHGYKNQLQSATI